MQQAAIRRQELSLPEAGLAPGIYFWLPEIQYHADPALGSSDIRAIRKDIDRWWRGSRFNANEAERALYQRDSKALIIGKAMHTLVLEGRDKFETFYVRRPDDPPGSNATDKAQLTKSAKRDLLAGQHLLHADDWELCARTADLIERHPDLATALVGGLNEVSVFWRRNDGVMCKARFDRLKPNGVGDIKSIENQYDRSLDAACVNAFLTLRYDMQAEHYLEARSQMRLLTARNAINVVTPDGIMHPETCGSVGSRTAHQLALDCANTDYHIRGDDGVEWFHGDRPGYAYQLIFIQKSVPGVYSFFLTPENAYLSDARQDIEIAIGSYIDMLRTVGPGNAPLPQWRVRELAYEEAPAWWQYRR